MDSEALRYSVSLRSVDLEAKIVIIGVVSFVSAGSCNCIWHIEKEDTHFQGMRLES